MCAIFCIWHAVDDILLSSILHIENDASDAHSANPPPSMLVLLKRYVSSPPLWTMDVTIVFEELSFRNAFGGKCALQIKR